MPLEFNAQPHIRCLIPSPPPPCPASPQPRPMAAPFPLPHVHATPCICTGAGPALPPMPCDSPPPPPCPALGQPLCRRPAPAAAAATCPPQTACGPYTEYRMSGTSAQPASRCGRREKPAAAPSAVVLTCAHTGISHATGSVDVRRGGRQRVAATLGPLMALRGSMDPCRHAVFAPALPWPAVRR